MRLLILGSLNRPAVTQLAMDRGTTVTYAADVARRLPCCAPAAAPICSWWTSLSTFAPWCADLKTEHMDIQHAAVAAEPVSRALVGRAVAEVERDLILETLKHCLGNRTHAAN
jgi:DNA-binding NtrC family response regulator